MPYDARLSCGDLVSRDKLELGDKRIAIRDDLRDCLAGAIPAPDALTASSVRYQLAKCLKLSVLPLSQAHNWTKRRRMYSGTETYLGTFAEKYFAALQ